MAYLLSSKWEELHRNLAGIVTCLTIVLWCRIFPLYFNTTMIYLPACLFKGTRLFNGLMPKIKSALWAFKGTATCWLSHIGYSRYMYNCSRLVASFVLVPEVLLTQDWVPYMQTPHSFSRIDAPQQNYESCTSKYYMCAGFGKSTYQACYTGFNRNIKKKLLSQPISHRSFPL